MSSLITSFQIKFTQDKLNEKPLMQRLRPLWKKETVRQGYSRQIKRQKLSLPGPVCLKGGDGGGGGCNVYMGV
jgi:hypothetical protein